MTEPQWETIEVPKGAFIGWGDHAGQHVTGKVLSYDPSGGTDFNQNVCPRLDVELIAPAASFDKAGARTDYPAGELVTLNVGLANLKRGVMAAALNSGDLVKITLVGLVKVDKGTLKEFDVKVARGAGGAATPRPAAQAAPPQQPGQQFDNAPPAQQFAAPQSTAPAGDPWAAAPAQPQGAEPPF